MANIIEKVKTFEDACAIKGINPEDFKVVVPAALSNHTKALLAHAKLVLINEVLNEDHTHVWNNGKWDKWYPYFRMKGSSSSGRFSFDCSVNLSSYSDCGSRLCYKSEELADYAGTQFEDLYREYFEIAD